MKSHTKVVVFTPMDICPNPIFITGVHRSGTSLMRRIVDSHPNIACPPESFFLSDFVRLADEHTNRIGFRNLGVPHTEVDRRIGMMARLCHEQYRLACEKARWADKTPQYVLHLEGLRRLFGETATFILVLRHPLDSAYSIWERGWQFEHSYETPIENTCHYVAKAMRAEWRFIEQHPDSAFVLFYDELVREPQSTLQRLFAFLGEPWCQRVLSYNQVKHDFGTEDPIVKGAVGFFQSFENWRAWSPSRSALAEEIMEDVMRRFGYDMDDALSCYASGSGLKVLRQADGSRR